jgi:hypothetical protein
MANKKTENAHYFDAVGSFTLPCTITGFAYSGGSAGGVASVSEHSGTAGNIIFKATVSTYLTTPPVTGIRLSVDGFRVDTLSSGYLIVYTE